MKRGQLAAVLGTDYNQNVGASASLMRTLFCSTSKLYNLAVRAIAPIRDTQHMSIVYRFEVTDCDVDDVAALMEFRRKRAEWLDWLVSDAHHAIRDQVLAIVWNDAVYRSLNEARQFGTKDSPTAATSGLLASFIDRGFISMQVLDICKITETSSSNPAKGVISLRRLFDDILANRELVTRQNYVCFDGLPYDYQAAKEQYHLRYPYQPDEYRRLPSEGPLAWSFSANSHKTFDRIAKVDAASRQRWDVIGEDVLQTIEGWFNNPVLQRIRLFRNKYIGHAADSLSRPEPTKEILGLTLDEIADAHRTIVQIAEAISIYLVQGPATGNVIPVYQGDPFRDLEKPFIPMLNIQNIREWWRLHETERDQWLNVRDALFSDHN